MIIHGRCHCANIRFELAWAPDPTEIPARACRCSFCVKHGGVWTSHPDAALVVHVRDPQHVSIYTFGTATADFHVCARCGVVPVVTSRIGERLHAVVSVNAFDGVDPALLRRGSADFEGEAIGDRLARRQRNWIADVRFIEGS
ncbi:hypothetical protein HLB44_32880 [Aquincola sp. S2]|uniref:CENP-V/GFA domain-containing protein n=1 Tax=Pseudaquabacterium terrae TaxID=2732868 RepID=A0ABX2ET02_9BURK|nr:hypothetical protein [Aquabacterium terrae]NRF71791.1 hypothetical protein [Aquabacterium terrae]